MAPIRSSPPIVAVRDSPVQLPHALRGGCGAWENRKDNADISRILHAEYNKPPRMAADAGASGEDFGAELLRHETVDILPRHDGIVLILIALSYPCNNGQIYCS